MQAAQQGATNAVPQRDARPGFTAGIDGDPAFNPFTYATTDPTTALAQPSNGTGATSTVLVNGFPLSGERPATGMGGGGHLTSAKVAFKSKVVSRAHAEIWCEGEGKVSVVDERESVFMLIPFLGAVFCQGYKIVFRHVFEPHPSLESGNGIPTVSHQGMHSSLVSAENLTKGRINRIQDGDIVQLGVDYQGGTEEMYRCVKMRIEVGRERQRGQNNFKYVSSQDALDKR